MNAENNISKAKDGIQYYKAIYRRLGPGMDQQKKEEKLGNNVEEHRSQNSSGNFSCDKRFALHSNWHFEWKKKLSSDQDKIEGNKEGS